VIVVVFFLIRKIIRENNEDNIFRKGIIINAHLEKNSNSGDISSKFLLSEEEV
jgi:hypothetical protein